MYIILTTTFYNISAKWAYTFYKHPNHPHCRTSYFAHKIGGGGGVLQYIYKTAGTPVLTRLNPLIWYLPLQVIGRNILIVVSNDFLVFLIHVSFHRVQVLASQILVHRFMEAVLINPTLIVILVVGRLLCVGIIRHH